MNSLMTIGKYLDQPMLVSKFSKAVPGVLAAGAVGYGLYDTYRAPENEKKKTFIKNFCVLGATVASILVATRGIKPVKIFGKEIFKGFRGLTPIKTPGQTKKVSERFLNRFRRMLIKSPAIDQETRNLFRNPRINQLLDNLVENPLKKREIGELHELIGKNQWGNKLLNKLIPDPENITSKKIFSEIGRLSLMGLAPVLGGIAGGITGDMLTEKKWKNRIRDKINEGSYQYLANIFLCNVGAGAALGIMEKMNIKSKASRALGMITGIAITGVIGGSAIANYFGQNVINRLFGGQQGQKENNKHHRGLYSERRPEALDIGLHVDDIATVAVMSGLRWIEPALPILYSVSGYRAGIGYRNGDNCPKKPNNAGKNRNCKKNAENFKGYKNSDNRVFERFTSRSLKYSEA